MWGKDFTGKSKMGARVMGLSVATVQEIRLPEQTPLQRAKSRNEEVLGLCRHLAEALYAWARLGKLCNLVERDKDWELLGYKSFGAWMMAVEELSGYSRASAYSYMGLWR